MANIAMKLRIGTLYEWRKDGSGSGWIPLWPVNSQCLESRRTADVASSSLDEKAIQKIENRKEKGNCRDVSGS